MMIRVRLMSVVTVIIIIIIFIILGPWLSAFVTGSNFQTTGRGQGYKVTPHGEGNLYSGNSLQTLFSEGGTVTIRYLEAS